MQKSTFYDIIYSELLYETSKTPRRVIMVSYKPLFKLLVDRNMSKADLRRLAEISPNTMTKLRRGEEVSMAVLNRICNVLGVSYGDIVEYIPVDGEKE